MPKGKLTPEGEVIAAYGAAMVASFQVLINCLEESDVALAGVTFLRCPRRVHGDGEKQRRAT